VSSGKPGSFGERPDAPTGRAPGWGYMTPSPVT
jgi:hypothetical protein